MRVILNVLYVSHFCLNIKIISVQLEMCYCISYLNQACNAHLVFIVWLQAAVVGDVT